MSSARELALTRNNSCTLYEVEGTLQALADSIYSSRSLLRYFPFLRKS